MELSISHETFSTGDLTKRTVSTQYVLDVTVTTEADQSIYFEGSRWLSGQALSYILLGTFGIVGNSLVVWVIACYPPLRSRVNNLFILNQSIIDLAASSMLIVHSGVRFFEGGLSGAWGFFYCNVWVAKPILWSLFLTSTCNLMFMTLERYVGIVHPLYHMARFTKQKAAVMMTVSWVVGPCWNFGYMMPTTVVTHGVCLPYTHWYSESWRLFVGFMTCSFYLFVPVLIMIFTYARMAMVLRSNLRPRRGATDNSSGKLSATEQNRKDKMDKVRGNVIKTLFVVSLCYLLCWSWNQIWFLLFLVGIDLDLNSTFYHFTVYASSTNCCINPIIYVMQYELFQKGIRVVLCGAADEDEDSVKHGKHESSTESTNVM